MGKKVDQEVTRQAKANDEEISAEELERALNELEALAGVSAADEDSDEDDEEDTEEVAKSVDSDEDEDSDEEEEVVAKSAKDQGKKLAKSEETEEDSDEDDDDEDEEDMGKSVSEGLYEDEQLAKAIEVSPFLESLVERTADSLEELQRSINDERLHNTQMMKSFAKVFRTLGDAIKQFDERLSTIETQPAHKPKGKVEVMERSFNGETPENKNAPTRLTKSQVSEALEQLAVTDKIKDYDVVRFESTGQMSDAVKMQLSSYLKEKGIIAPGQATSIQ